MQNEEEKRKKTLARRWSRKVKKKVIKNLLNPEFRKETRREILEMDKQNKTFKEKAEIFRDKEDQCQDEAKKDKDMNGKEENTGENKAQPQ